MDVVFYNKRTNIKISELFLLCLYLLCIACYLFAPKKRRVFQKQDSRKSFDNMSVKLKSTSYEPS